MFVCMYVCDASVFLGPACLNATCMNHDFPHSRSVSRVSHIAVLYGNTLHM